MRPEVDEIFVGDAPDAWERLGFEVRDAVVALDGVRIRLGGPGEGITGWSLRNLAPDQDLDGLSTSVSEAPPTEPCEHTIGALAVDHVVAVTPDLDRTTRKLRDAGLDYRSTREAGDFSQAFFVVGPCLLELEGPAHGDVRFWGLTIVVEDLEATAGHLGDWLGRITDAVQPGRRIATLRSEAGLSVPLAFMTPR